MTSRNSGINILRVDIPESRRGNLVPISLLHTQRGRCGPSTGNCLHWQGFLTLREQCGHWAPDTNHLYESPWGAWVSASTVPLRKRDTHQQHFPSQANHLRAWRLKNWKIDWRCFWRFHWFSREPDPLRKTCFWKGRWEKRTRGAPIPHHLPQLDFVTVFPKTKAAPYLFVQQTNWCIFTVFFPIIGECYLLLPWCLR